MRCLDFGSGYNPRKAYECCDIIHNRAVEWWFDKEQNRIRYARANTFKVIRMRHVLHHIVDFNSLFAEFNRVMSKGANLYIIDVNEGHYAKNNIFDWIYYRFINRDFSITWSSHYRNPSKALEANGFQIISRKTIKHMEYITARKI